MSAFHEGIRLEDMTRCLVVAKGARGEQLHRTVERLLFLSGAMVETIQAFPYFNTPICLLSRFIAMQDPRYTIQASRLVACVYKKAYIERLDQKAVTCTLLQAAALCSRKGEHLDAQKFSGIACALATSKEDRQKAAQAARIAWSKGRQDPLCMGRFETGPYAPPPMLLSALKHTAVKFLVLHAAGRKREALEKEGVDLSAFPTRPQIKLFVANIPKDQPKA